MPKYNESTVTETSSKTLYEYAYGIDIHNPLNKTPVISFKTAMVERDNETGEEVLLEMKRRLSETYTGNEAFNLVHPSTGDIVGQMDYDTIFLAMYSLFFHVASKEDAQ